MPQLTHVHPLKTYRKPRIDHDRFQPGVVVYTRVSIRMALKETGDARWETLFGHDELQGGKFSIGRRTRPSSVVQTSRASIATYGAGFRSKSSIRPAVILFANKPSEGDVIMAPITSWRGYSLDHPVEGSKDNLTRQACFPIPFTNSHLAKSRMLGHPDVLQRTINIPQWPYRDRDGEENKTPQYLVIGTPITCKMEDLLAMEWECFHMRIEETHTAQLICMDFMGDSEAEALGLEEEVERLEASHPFGLYSID